MTTTAANLKILIADDDQIFARRLSAHLESHGFETRATADAEAARLLIDEWQPRFVLADLMLPRGGAHALLDHVRLGRVRRRTVGLIVMSGHSSAGNVRDAIARGARDYLVKPFEPEELLRRLVFHVRGHHRPAEALRQGGPAEDEAGLMLQLTGLVLRQALAEVSLEEILYNLTRMVALRTEGVRCSIIHCLDQRRGVVVTSHDSRDATGVQLDLYKYPEVLHAVNTRSSLTIDDLDDSPELREVRRHVTDISFNAIVVCPVSRAGETFGALSLRLPATRHRVSDHEVRFVEGVANVISLALNDRRHALQRDFWDRPDPRATLPFTPRGNKIS